MLEQIEDIKGEIGSFQNDIARGERRHIRGRVLQYEAFLRGAQKFPPVYVRLPINQPCTKSLG